MSAGLFLNKKPGKRGAMIVAVVAASVAMHASCLASASASASASNFRYVLTDLDPNDGVVPTISWVPSPQDGRLYVRGSFDGSNVFAASPVGNELVTREWAQGGDAVSASIEGAAELATTAISVSATNVLAIGESTFSLAEGYSRNGSFVLSAGTSVSFLLDYEVSGLLTELPLPGNTARGLTALEGNLYNPNGTISDTESRSSRNRDLAGSVRSGTLSLTLSNWSDQSRRGSTSFESYVFASVYTAGGSVVSSVPEPSTYAMLLAGLALVPVVRRRRQ